jgi:TMP repeat
MNIRPAIARPIPTLSLNKSLTTNAPRLTSPIDTFTPSSPLAGPTNALAPANNAPVASQSSAATGIGGFFSNLWGGIKSFFSGLLGKADTAVNNAAPGLFSQAKSWLGGLFDSIASKALSWVNGLFGSAQNTLNP